MTPATSSGRATSADSDTVPGVTVIIPTFNERHNVTHVIARCLEALPPTRFETEVLVVDDDSPDYTWQYSERLYSHDPRVHTLRRCEDPGLSRAVADGFAAASHDYCAVIDADLQHPPEKLPALIEALEAGADIAIGSRHAPAGGSANWSRRRKLISKGATILARAALPAARTVSDPMSGFFAVRRPVVDDVALDPQGYKILLEVLGKGEYDTVVEVPYVFRDRERGESKLTAGEYKRFLEHLSRLAVSSRGLDRVIAPDRAVRATEFAVVGGSGALLNMLVFAALVIGTDVHFLVAGVAAFLAAVNWNCAGNWLLTYDRPHDDVRAQYVRFHVVSVVGFTVYSVTLTVAVFASGSPLVANTIAILAGAGVNFVGSDEAVFPRGDASRGTESSDRSSLTAIWGKSND